MIVKISAFILVCIISCVNAETIVSENVDQNAVDSSTSKLLYQKLFKLKRTEHLKAVVNIRKISKYEKQYEMINILGKKMFNLLEKHRFIVESSGYIPRVSPFPLEDSNLLESLTLLLENTAFFGDIIMQFPKITSLLLKKNNNWKVQYEWALTFCTQSDLVDDSTTLLFSLVTQELYPEERSPDYKNPYWQQTEKPPTKNNKDVKKKKKKSKLKKGPRLAEL